MVEYKIAINGIRGVMDSLKVGVVNESFAINVIEEILNDLFLKDITPNKDWIDVNKRLPIKDPKRKRYLVFTDDLKQEVVEYREHSTGYLFENDYGNITHWRPLPIPPPPPQSLKVERTK